MSIISYIEVIVSIDATAEDGTPMVYFVLDRIFQHNHQMLEPDLPVRGMQAILR